MLLLGSVVLSFTALSCLNKIAFYPVVTCEIVISEIKASWNVVRFPECTELTHTRTHKSFLCSLFSLLKY